MDVLNAAAFVLIIILIYSTMRNLIRVIFADIRVYYVHQM